LLAALLILGLPFSILAQYASRLVFSASFLVNVVCTLALFGSCLWLNRRGKVDFACRLLLIGYFAMRTLRLFMEPPTSLPLSSSLYNVSAFSIVASGFLIGRRAPFGFALVNLCILALHSLQHAAEIEAIPGSSVYPTLGTLLLSATACLMLALLAWLGAGGMEDAIARAGQADELEVLYHEADYQRRLAEHLRELAARLTGELDCEELLRQVAAGVVALGYAGCAILLTETDATGKRCLVGHLSTLGDSTDITALCYEEDDPEAVTALNGQVRCIPDPAAHAGYDAAIQQSLRALGVTHQLALPIRYRGEILGSLVVWAATGSTTANRNAPDGKEAASLPTDTDFDPAGPFSLNEVVFLSTLADHAALALGNAMLHQETVQAHESLEQEHEAVIAQAEELTAKNLEMLSVQAELEAQYRALEIANAQLSALATTDGMTGLANHRAFQEELARQVARVQRASTPLSLLLMDVDHFKQYNDTFGHPAGDEVLKSVGRILQQMVREGDFAARYGGEEFAIILPDTEAETAMHVAERIRATVGSHAFAHRRVTLSMGISSYCMPEAAATMLQRADTALYAAKAEGRNRIFYMPMSQAVAASSLAFSAEEVVQSEIPLSLEPNARPVEADAPFPALLAGLSTGEEGSDPQEWGSTYLTHLTRHAQMKAVGLLTGGLEGMLQESTSQVLSALLDVLDRRGAEPRGHSERVTRYALLLSNAVATLYEEQRHSRPLLPRLTPGDLIDLAFGAMLHDIGKVGIPDAILRKVDKLTEDEWHKIRRHPLAGAEMIADCPLLSRALPVIRFHHERWDGIGYPQGLAGENIPLGARIFAVCDTFDILTTDKPYRARLDFGMASAEIARGAGKQFDPDIVEAFLRISEQEWQVLGDQPLSLEPVAAGLPHAA
jgi:diguanylate cyclase (GGDEF)-like protein